MSHAREILCAGTCGVDKFLTESFATQVDEEPEIEDPAAVKDKASLLVTLDGREMQGRAGELLLNTLRRAKIPIPTGCREGRCGTCRLRLHEGKVTMKQKGGLSQKEEVGDVILACCTTLLSDVSLMRC